MTPRLLCLMLAPLSLGTSAFVFTGLLDPMAIDLNVSVPLIGQLQTVFAVACAIGGPVVARMTMQYDRAVLLLALLAGLVLMNIASAMAGGVGLLFTVRLLGGFFCAVIIPAATVIAIELVAEEKRPQAIALVLAGYTLAFLIGVPLGSIVGELYGWRAAFWFTALLSAVSLLVIAMVTPRGIKAPPVPAGAFRTVMTPGNLKLMTLTMLCFAASFATVTFMGPVITKATGITGSGIGLMQAAIGIGSIAGLYYGARLAPRPARFTTTVLFLVLAVSQLLYFISMATDLGPFAVITVLIAIGGGSAALFALSPVVQVRLAAGPAATVAFAMNASMLYFGQGLGAAVGGVVARGFGLPSVGLAGVALALSALIVIARLERE